MYPMDSMGAVGPAIRQQIRDLIHGLDGDFASVPDALRSASPDGTLLWHLQSLGLVLLCVGVGFVCAFLAKEWLRHLLSGVVSKMPRDRSEKLAFLALRVVVMGVNLAMCAAISFALATLLTDGSHAFQVTFLAVMGAVVEIFIAFIVFMSILSPIDPQYRVLPFSDAEAWRLFGGSIAVIALGVTLIEASFWIVDIGLSRNLHILALLGSTLVTALALASLAIVHRHTVGRIILGSANDAAGGKARLVPRLAARLWHVAVALYFLAAWGVTAINVLLGKKAAIAPVVIPVMLLLSAFLLYGLALLGIDRLARRSARARLMETPGEASMDETGLTLSSRLPAAPRSLKDLAEEAARIAIGVIGAVILLETWNVTGVVGMNPLWRFMDVLIVTFIAYLCWQAIKILIDRRIAEEGVVEAPEPGEEGGAAAASSRLATLLPLFRNILLITVAIIGAMIALSRLGVDVGPLFAGAGVVGLAIGFGAQTLIRDIFSGAFFLIDDAFRKGEYIDLGGVKGTVEKISLRSMQLRHHLGALHTVPFGEIKQLTNYSRDWAMMKLTLRLTYGTDVEKVRRLIKDLGKALQQDPEIGSKFLQPLKSQGVYSMEDSAMLVRVKFMTKPGDQFIIRKRVYQDIRDLFTREGIQFAHREVTVRLAGDESTPNDRKALAGAVLPVIEDQIIDASGPLPSEAR